MELTINMPAYRAARAIKALLRCQQGHPLELSTYEVEAVSELALRLEIVLRKQRTQVSYSENESQPKARQLDWDKMRESFIKRYRAERYCKIHRLKYTKP